MAVAYGTLKRMQRPFSLVVLVLFITAAKSCNAKVTSEPRPWNGIPRATTEPLTADYDRPVNATYTTPTEDASTMGTSSYEFVEQGNVSVVYERFTTLDRSAIHVASFRGPESVLPSEIRLQVVSDVTVSFRSCESSYYSTCSA